MSEKEPTQPVQDNAVERADALVRGLLDVNPTHEDRVSFTSGFLSGFRHSTAVHIAAWLESLAPSETQPGDYYARAADKLRRGEWIR